MHGTPPADPLPDLARRCPSLMRCLRLTRDLAPPGAAVGAGRVRNLVWNAAHGLPLDAHARDVDVVWFAPGPWDPDAEARVEAAFRREAPDLDVDACNQAWVHHWYTDRFGGPPVAPLHTLQDGIATWPETATCVALRLTVDDRVEVLAPLGVDDLYGLVLRHNPRRVPPDAWARRCAAKRFTQRWPRLRAGR